MAHTSLHACLPWIVDSYQSIIKGFFDALGGFNRCYWRIWQPEPFSNTTDRDEVVTDVAETCVSVNRLFRIEGVVGCCVVGVIHRVQPDSARQPGPARPTPGRAVAAVPYPHPAFIVDIVPTFPSRHARRIRPEPTHRDCDSPPRQKPLLSPFIPVGHTIAQCLYHSPVVRHRPSGIVSAPGGTGIVAEIANIAF